MGFLGGHEILLCIVVACFLFGPSLLRGAGRKLGENIRESKKALGEIKEAIKGPDGHE